MQFDPQRRRRWVASYGISLGLHGFAMLWFVLVAVEITGTTAEVRQAGDISVFRTETAATAEPAPQPTAKPAVPPTAAARSAIVPAHHHPRSRSAAAAAAKAVELPALPQPKRSNMPAAPPELARNVRDAETQAKVASQPAPISAPPTTAPEATAPAATQAPLQPSSPTTITRVLPTTAIPYPISSAVQTIIASTAPTAIPSAEISLAPSKPPTALPSAAPTSVPTSEPTAAPTQAPTASPSPIPTSIPSAQPTAAPTVVPTIAQPRAPSPAPARTALPSAQPSALATAAANATRATNQPHVRTSTAPRAPAVKGESGSSTGEARAGSPGRPQQPMRPSGARLPESATTGSPTPATKAASLASLNDRLKALSGDMNIDYGPKRVKLGDAQSTFDNAMLAYEQRLAPPLDILKRTFGFIYERRSASKPDSIAYVYDSYAIGPITICKAWKIVEHPFQAIREVGAATHSGGIGGAVATNANSPDIRHDNGGMAEVQTVQFPCSPKSYTAIPRGSLTTPLPRHPDLLPLNATTPAPAPESTPSPAQASTPSPAPMFTP